ncbi:hypothetical protein J7384_03690 [Endozoicomonas sp. G2_1]|uniref:DUF4350 domain-containing protein n=1 Tax=Endozoicomonas sp. G2_1 TaxID=2821091 RepID=UPI001ADB9FD6|nr:DUF4350 domain-containing protein [Endozoicomonas sp. G2_1]MBO9489458.1 hypothetical protein [Endozoicomonas sp. G2_1]
MDKQRFFFILLACAGLLLFAYVAFGVKWQKVEQEVGLTQKASREPLLASIELLKKYDKTIERLSSQEQKELVIEDVRNGSIMISEATLLEHQQLAEKLLPWVESGGHLIYVLAKNRQQLNLDDNAILQATQVEVSDQDYFGFSTWLNDEPSTNLILKSEQNELELYFSYHSVFSSCSGTSYYEQVTRSDEQVETKESTDLILLCELSYGDGFITFLPSIELISNYGLRHLDHGAFLLWLIGANNAIYYLPSLESPNWLSQFWHWSWQLVILLVSTLVLGMWYVAVRLGHAKIPFVEQKAPFLQHVNALGNFFFAHQHHDYAKQTLVNDIEQCMAKRNPRFMQLTLEQKVALISQFSGKEQNSIMQLYTQPMPEDEEQRVKYIQLFKALRKSL